MMSGAETVLDRFERQAGKPPVDVYNYGRFRATHVWTDARRSLASEGIAPGEVAPPFVLPRAEGGQLALEQLRGKPVLLRFGSPT